ncbi:MAG: hypothetical protein KKG47_02465 [Proteobacteria bacterium]|nr:hypothetical protein [Pseudomonadota bacterium]
MIDRYSDIVKDFIKVLGSSRVAMAGAVVSSVIFPVLAISVFLDIQGVVKNPYFGFLIYMVMGPLFVGGVLTTLVGLIFFRDTEEIGLFTLEYLKEQLTMPGRFSRVRKHLYISSFIAAATLLVIGVVSIKGFDYTESVRFCATFCHTVMESEYISHQNSPHSRIPCVRCHISSESGLFDKSKISGIRMIFATLFDRYDKPIRTPISSLRPSREVCEQCHRPEIFHGDKLYIKDYFLADEKNTHVQTVLLMHVGSGGSRGEHAHGIHWHVSPEHRTFFQEEAGSDGRISSVKLLDHDGDEFVFNRVDDHKAEVDVSGGNTYKLMDCLDCHNRPTHIFLSPEEALDRKISDGSISRDLPFIKQRALEVIQKEYRDRQEARKKISIDLESWYRDNYPGLITSDEELLEKAVNSVYQAWSENVFPEMNVGWNTYQDNLGHEEGRGCFRCHSDAYRTKDGRVISDDCSLCHVVLAEKEESPDIMRILHGKKEQ